MYFKIELNSAFDLFQSCFGAKNWVRTSHKFPLTIPSPFIIAYNMRNKFVFYSEMKMFEFFNIISYFCSCLPYCATKRGRGYHCVCVCANSHGAAYRATWNANCPSPECTQLRLFVERTWDAHISAEPQKQHWINNVAILTPDRMKCVFALSGIVVDFFFCRPWLSLLLD